MADGATLQGFTIINSGYYGAYCQMTKNAVMKNCVMAGIPHTGFRYYTCSATLINNTFGKNGYAALTSGHEGNTVTIMNNIFASGGSAYELSPVSSYNLFFNSSYFVGNGIGDKQGDPLFVDAAAGDYKLKPGSPAIDAGNPDPAFNDSDGSRNDMGAFGGPALAP